MQILIQGRMETILKTYYGMKTQESLVGMEGQGTKGN
jgi:hypothetical protein